MNGPIVNLPQEDIDLAVYVGQQRFSHSRTNQYGKFNYATTTPITIDREIEGVIGEIAVARWSGLKYWVPEYRHADRSPDVAGYQVRATRHPRGCLIVRPLDEKKHAEPFVLAIIDQPNRKVRLVGWIMGRDAMTDRYLRRPDKLSKISSWWVPQSHLQALPYS